MFLPTTKSEINQLGWDSLDVILVTGDAYIDSPYVGVALIGRVLQQAGYRVGILGQPDTQSVEDIQRLGEPNLFWGVSGGCIDSLVANRTASGARRKSDDYTAGGINDRRPDRAVLVYSNLIKQGFKNGKPIVLGGIEASLRRVSHYDFWSDKIRRSILIDAKADYLLYGMAEKSVVDLADALKNKKKVSKIRGLCYLSKTKPAEFADAVELPTHKEVTSDADRYISMFKLFYDNNDPLTAKCIFQQQDTRFLVQNPPAEYLTQAELDQVHGLDYQRAAHPYYARQGKVKALETIRFSIPAHRGCYGECNFCAIAVHQGRTVRSRSIASVVSEARSFTDHPDFKGVISDVGGPTANMYGFECEKKLNHGACKHKRCMFPKLCPQLRPDHGPQVKMLRKLRDIEGIKRIFVASGLRHDLLLADKKCGQPYLHDLVKYHTSGQLKIAPEHTSDNVLRLMGKPGGSGLQNFKVLFDRETKKAGKSQFLTYYFIAAHPGCRDRDMRDLKAFTARKLKLRPEQVQIFTPLPSTWSAVMYHTGKNPFSGKPCFVEKGAAGRKRQKELLYCFS